MPFLEVEQPISVLSFEVTLYHPTMYADGVRNSGCAVVIVIVILLQDLWEKFEEIDVNKDHRLGLREFVTGCHLVGGAKIEDPEKMFRAMDNNGGGYVLFDEFCTSS